MATPVYSTMFIRKVNLIAGPGQVYTVPSGYLAVIRFFSAYQYGGGTSNYAVLRGGASEIIRIGGALASPGSTYDGDLHAVVKAGETMSIAVGGSVGFDVHCSGYLLSTP